VAPISLKMLVPSRAIAVFPVFRLLTDFVCLLTYEFCLSLWKIARCSVILLLPLFMVLIVSFIYHNNGSALTYNVEPYGNPGLYTEINPYVSSL
jgi:hypothetical protein